MKTYLPVDLEDAELANVTMFVNTLDDTKKEKLARDILKGLGFFGLRYYADIDIEDEYKSSYEEEIDADEMPAELTEEDLAKIKFVLLEHEANTCEMDGDIIADRVREYVEQNHSFKL